VRVRVRLFASLRETAGTATLDLDLPDGATAGMAWERLAASYPTLLGRRRSLATAVNRRYVPFDAPLSEGDEVVFIPPVSGG
jgi:molybdopterin converting factor subunit 1